eukprot:5221291-Prorocentrum_lima.AAC.1
MTSSLVGSEMCIRDRKNTDPVCPVPPHYSCSLQNSDTVILSRMHRAVSYTHLTLPTICSV